MGTNGKNGGIYNLKNLIEIIDLVWSSNFSNQQKFVILTGGEPLLQVNNELWRNFKRKNFVAIETNGTIKTSIKFNWICVSPKENSIWKLKHGDELKSYISTIQIQFKRIRETKF